MVDVAEADSQPSAHPQGMLFLGHGCGQAPGELQGSFRLAGVWGWMLSLLDQWKSRTPWAQVQYTTLGGQTTQKLGLLTSAIQRKRSNSLSQTRQCVLYSPQHI